MSANTNTKQVNYYARSATYSANRHLESVIYQLTNAANDMRKIQAQVNDADVPIPRKLEELNKATSLLSNLLGAAGFTQLAMAQVEFAQAESKFEAFLRESPED